MRAVYTPAAARRITAILFVAQSLGSAALIANATVNPIVGATLSGRDASNSVVKISFQEG